MPKNSSTNAINIILSIVRMAAVINLKCHEVEPNASKKLKYLKNN